MSRSEKYVGGIVGDFIRFSLDENPKFNQAVESQEINLFNLKDEFIRGEKKTPKKEPKPKISSPKPSSSTMLMSGEYTRANLEKLKISELKEILKIHGKIVCGVKKELIDRILAMENGDGDEDDSVPVAAPKSKTVKKQPTPSDGSDAEEKPKKRLSKKPPSKSKVEAKIQREEIEVEEDEYGNLFDPKSRIVFNRERIAVGFKDEEDNVHPLTSEKLQYCRKHKLKSEIPDDLVNLSDED